MFSQLWKKLTGAAPDPASTAAPVQTDPVVKPEATAGPKPSPTTASALRVANDPNSPLSKIVSLFEHDPMLAQALLRQANSVYYRRGDATVNSLGAAVQRVGLQAVQSVLMGALVQSTLGRPGGAYNGLVTKVWTHMQRTAPIARGLSRAF